MVVEGDADVVPIGARNRRLRSLPQIDLVFASRARVPPLQLSPTIPPLNSR